jgi:hypothetical protein
MIKRTTMVAVISTAGTINFSMLTVMKPPYPKLELSSYILLFCSLRASAREGGEREVNCAYI